MRIKRIFMFAGFLTILAISASNAYAEDLILNNQTVELSGNYFYENVSLVNSTISINKDLGWLNIEAVTISIDSSSLINGDGKGFKGASGRNIEGKIRGLNGLGPGGGKGGHWYTSLGNNQKAGKGGRFVDDKSSIPMKGSGGGEGGRAKMKYSNNFGGGGNGGGGIKLSAHEIIINGNVYMRGDKGGKGDNCGTSWEYIYGNGGGGSGGEIIIEGQILNVTGNISVSGGQYGGNCGILVHNGSSGRISKNVVTKMKNYTISIAIDPNRTTFKTNDIILIQGFSNIENLKLKRNGITIPNPYSAVFPVGTYEFIFEVEISNYVRKQVKKTITVLAEDFKKKCSSNQIYIFSAEIPVDSYIDMSKYVNLNFIRDDLKDISGTENIKIWNTNSKNIIYVQKTAGSATKTMLNFGNVFVENILPLHGDSPSNIVQNLEVNENQKYFRYKIFNELNWKNELPSKSNITMVINCKIGSNKFKITNMTIDGIIPYSSKLNKIELEVRYSNTEFYKRSLILESIERPYLELYLVDAFSNIVDRVDFRMMDSEYQNKKFQILKNIGGKKVIITEGFFDTSKLFYAYLARDSVYELRSVNAKTLTYFGTIPVLEPEEKELSIAKIKLNPDSLLISDNILFNAYLSENKKALHVHFEDEIKQSKQLRVTTEFANGTVFQNETFYNINKLITNYNVTNYPNEGWIIKFSLDHETFGNSPVEYFITIFAPSTFLAGTDRIWLHLFAMGICLCIGGITIRRNIPISIITFILFVAVFWNLGWLEIKGIFFAFLIFMGMLGIVIHFKRGGE